jgi:hypothetical protein
MAQAVFQVESGTDLANAIASVDAGGADAALDTSDTIDVTGLISWEFPRLCRGGSKSLTFPAVAPHLSTDKTRM